MRRLFVFAFILSGVGFGPVPNGGLHAQSRPPRAEPPRDRPAGQRGVTVYYRNCDEARAAGAAPIRRGEPGYRPPLDRDDDGIACEPYRGRR
jgi:hypothetical protein